MDTHIYMAEFFYCPSEIITTLLISYVLTYRASQVRLVVKNLPANAGNIRDMGSIPGWEDLLEKGMATHSRILAWRIP